MDRKGRPCLLNIKGDTGNGAFSKKLEISKKQTSFTFENIKTPVVPSILRNFSSPIKLLRTSSEEELQVLMRYELDPYVRWDAFQTCAFSVIKELDYVLIEETECIYLYAGYVILRRKPRVYLYTFH